MQSSCSTHQSSWPRQPLQQYLHRATRRSEALCVVAHWVSSGRSLGVEWLLTGYCALWLLDLSLVVVRGAVFTIPDDSPHCVMMLVLTALGTAPLLRQCRSMKHTLARTLLPDSIGMVSGALARLRICG